MKSESEKLYKQQMADIYVKLYKQMADIYVEREGASLRDEIAESSPTPSLDRKVRGKIFRAKYRLHVRAAIALAACVVLAVALPITSLWQSQPIPPAPAIHLPTADILDDGIGVEGFGEGVGLPIVSAFEGDFEGGIAPLGFELPEGFLQQYGSSEFGRSFHILRGREHEVITLVIYCLDRASYDFELYLSSQDIFTAWQVNGYTLYYSYGENYSILELEKDHKWYALRGSEDCLDSLMLLGEAIVEG